jgi:Domain of unknown function (DUF4279)
MTNVVPFKRRSSGGSSSDEGSQRRFDVQLFIIHPSLDPSTISAELGLEPTVQHRVGGARKTPKGTSLPGNYPDTRWRYSERHHVREQWFVGRIDELLERLMPHKAFLLDLRTDGGTAYLIVQFLGDGYFGDALSRQTLVKMVELGLDFGIEVYEVPQSE